VGMKKLPDDLAAVESDELAHQGFLRDERLAPLFRRWPRLTHLEMRQLKTLYAERVRIAKYVGKFGRGARAISPKES
jgi:hypothetical protein